MSASEKTPLIVVGDYTPTIPFYFSLFVAETLLESSDELNPLNSRGLPENLKPKIGSRAIYRLISDGIHAPIFGAGFKKKNTSMGYDYTPGAVNILEFVYDGFDFWYSMASDSAEKTPEFIGNYGLLPTELYIRVSPSVAAIKVDDVAKASAYDFINSIHYTGTQPLLYRLKQSGPGPWVENTNPRLCVLNFNCTELGTQPVLLQVTDGTLTSEEVETYVLIQDNGGFC